MGKILIKNGKVWDGERFCFADVLTENEKISKIAEQIDEAAEFEYDASGKIVSAGLVDAHVHMRGINKEFGIHAELSTIPFGVTAAADACGAYGDKALLDSFLLKNVIFVPAEFHDNKACFNSTEKMIEKYGEKVVGIKVYFDTQISDVQDINPLYEIVEFVEKKNLIIMVHSSNSPVSMAELLGVLRKGDILTHAYHGGTNNVSEDGFKCIKTAKKRGVIIDAGLAGYVHTDFKVFENAISCGAVPDVISTDITRFSAYKRGGRYGMTMCMSIAKHLGMSEEDIFRAVTSAPAKALGKENEWGCLKVGRCADLAVFDHTDEGFDLTDKAGNRVVSETGYRCVLTVADGELVYRN
ncbi:MAG: amidohydrolase family protein [Clostridia bacterium]|nr:amidohydrolase family protein [Clostridia bacterium]